MTHTCDVAIIGAGTAGMAAYRAARAHTDRVLLIEAEHYGPTCARVGCMPSKLLIAAADAAQAVRDAPPFGVHAEPPCIDGRAVMQRVRSERDRFVGFVLETVQAWPEATVRPAPGPRARFLSAPPAGGARPPRASGAGLDSWPPACWTSTARKSGPRPSSSPQAPTLSFPRVGANAWAPA